MWVMAWAKLDPTDRRETRRTWALAVGEILLGKAPTCTRGPVEATIAALMHLGWRPAAPDFWVISDSVKLRLDGKVYTRFQNLAKAQHGAQR